MPFFPPKTIQEVTYTLNHLDPFTFNLQIDPQTSRVVAVQFGFHCFTEEISAAHTPDFRYSHQGEIRAFDLDRHELSRLLPNIVETLGSRSVYQSRGANYFTLRQTPLPQFTGPYLIFFNVLKAKNPAYDVVMNVESAYMKPGMADRASPVKFTTLVEKTATNQRVPVGPLMSIKRK